MPRTVKKDGNLKPGYACRGSSTTGQWANIGRLGPETAFGMARAAH
jgi:hypothetical protein